MTTTAAVGSGQENAKQKGRSGFKLFLIILLSVFLGVLAAAWVIKATIFPKELRPVSLSVQEKQRVNAKLQALGYQGEALATAGASGTTGGRLEPQVYTEVGANREVRFSEKELNGLIAGNAEMAQRLAIDLSDNLASARLLVPLDPDFPVMGGQTLKINAGVEILFSDGRPSVRLRGVSLWGVPLPNAWLGNLKNVDLVEQFGANPGFWQSFAAGIEMVDIRDGELFVKLKE